MRDLAKYLFLAAALVYVVERSQPVTPAAPQAGPTPAPAVVEEQKESPPQASDPSPSDMPAPSGPDDSQDAGVGVFLPEQELFTEPAGPVVQASDEPVKAVPVVKYQQPVYYYRQPVQYRAPSCSGPNCSQPSRGLFNRWRR
jgi:hypothetical protein